MAIYPLSVKPISRSAGRSSTGAAAYRSASHLVDERTGEVFDYTKKRGVEHTEIVVPAGSAWKPGRAELWNSAELAEKRKDSCVAREHEVALPNSLNDEQRLSLVREYAADLANRHGCAVDFAIHQPRPDATEGQENWHAHVLCTTRVVEGEGLGGKCEREKAGRKRTEDLKAERQRWEEICNKHLAAAGVAEQVDCRSLVDQGVVDREPTTHAGPSVSAMKRKGRSSRRDEDQQQRQRDAEQAADQRQAADAARDLAAGERLRRRLSREPNRLHGENSGNRYARLDGLTKEDRKNGRSVWRFKSHVPGAGARGSVALIDHGDSISLPKTTDSRIGAAVALAKEKGWEGVVLTGSDDFKKKMTEAAFKAGLSVENVEMQSYLSELRQKAEEQQKALVAPPATPARPAATPVPATLPKTPENPFANLSPAELGDRLRQVEIQLERQKAALKHADSMGYATLCNKQKHLKTQLAQAKARIFEDGPMLRGVFSSHASLRFGQALEMAQADRKAAMAEIEKSKNTHPIGRLLAAGKLREAERRLADAQRREQEAAKRIEKIERAAQEMADPKIREAYRRFGMARMREHNQDIERLTKVVDDVVTERGRIERRADFYPSEYQRLADEKKQLEALGSGLAGEQHKQFEATRDPEAEKRRQEDAADTLAKRRRLMESNSARARSTQSPSM